MVSIKDINKLCGLPTLRSRVRVSCPVVETYDLTPTHAYDENLAPS